MGIEEAPSGFLLTTVEDLVGYFRKASLWPVTFGLACCAIEMMAAGAPRYDISRFGMEVFRASPRQADLMIVAGRVSQKMAPVVRQVYDQMSEPKWVLSMGVCASSGGMFNNYAIVQGVDHIVPVDIYLPGCPPRPEMLINAILALHEQIQNEPLGANRKAAAAAAEAAAMAATPTSQMTGLLQVTRREDRRRRRREAGRRRRPAAQPTSEAALEAGSQNIPAEGRPQIEVVDVRRGMFGASGTGDTSGYGGLVTAIALPGPERAAVRRLVRRGRGHPHRGARRVRDHLRGRGRVRRRRPRGAHAARRARAPRRGRAGAPGRPGPAVRAQPRRLGRALPARRRPRAARRLPPGLGDPLAPAAARGRGPGRRPAPAVDGRRCTRPTTGTSGRPTTSSG